MLPAQQSTVRLPSPTPTPTPPAPTPRATTRSAMLRIGGLVVVLIAAIVVAHQLGWFDYRHTLEHIHRLRGKHSIGVFTVGFVLVFGLAAAIGMPALPFAVVGRRAVRNVARRRARVGRRDVGGDHRLLDGAQRSARRGAALDANVTSGPPRPWTTARDFTGMLRLRLLPVLPLGVVNFVGGLARAHFGAYLAATALGILPSITIYSYFADSLARTGRQRAHERADQPDHRQRAADCPVVHAQAVRQTRRRGCSGERRAAGPSVGRPGRGCCERRGRSAPPRRAPATDDTLARTSLLGHEKDRPAIERAPARAHRHRMRHAGAGRRPASREARRGRRRPRRRRHHQGRPRPSRRPRAASRAGRHDVVRGADDLRLRRRSMVRHVPRRPRRARGRSPSKRGPIASAPGARASRKSSPPSRTCSSSCSKARSSRARHRAARSRRPRARRCCMTAKMLDDRRDTAIEKQMQRALDDDLLALMREHLRPTDLDALLAATSASSSIDRRARFAAWYEMFPRSQTVPDRRRAAASRARSPTRRRVCRVSPSSASTSCICRRSIRSATRIRKGKNNSLTPEPDDVGSPWAIGNEHGGHTAIEPGARHARRLRSLRRDGARARTGGRARLRAAVLARSSVGARTSGLVSRAARRLDPVRRESAEEVSGHLSAQLLVRRPARTVERLPRRAAASGSTTA